MNILKVGEDAPNFSCKNQYGVTISLSEMIGKKIVLFFYPKANTPGCTAEACNLNDNYSRFKSQGYEVIGVSADSEKVQKNFSDKFSFNYSLLCDVDKKIISSYGAWGQKKMYGKQYMGIIRKTIIIDESGKIEQIIEKVKTKEHSSQILNQ
tara:strand:+ start:3384 stop:3839 length:456 start_codon:yes stop_codon:yes gene_type:complete